MSQNESEFIYVVHIAPNTISQGECTAVFLSECRTEVYTSFKLLEIRCNYLKMCNIYFEVNSIVPNQEYQ